MAETVFGLYGAGDDIVRVTVRQTSDSALMEHASGYADSPAAAILGSAETQWGDRLPGSPDALFRWLLAQPQATLVELLAYCTARSINAVVGRPRGRNHSDALADALGVDMADWWRPTTSNYFGRVSRAQLLDALQQAVGADHSIVTRKMKKDQLIAYCGHLFQDVRWVPVPLRPLGMSPVSAGDD
jgi:ParB family chromosome partitioning protein